MWVKVTVQLHMSPRAGEGRPLWTPCRGLYLFPAQVPPECPERLPTNYCLKNGPAERMSLADQDSDDSEVILPLFLAGR